MNVPPKNVTPRHPQEKQPPPKKKTHHHSLGGVASGVTKVLESRGVGARLRDSDAGDEVREGSGAVEVSTGSDSESESSSRGVGGASRVNEEELLGGEVMREAGVSESEAEGRASSSASGDIELTAYVVSGVSASVIVLGVDGAKEDAV